MFLLFPHFSFLSTSSSSIPYFSCSSTSIFSHSYHPPPSSSSPVVHISAPPFPSLLFLWLHDPGSDRRSVYRIETLAPSSLSDDHLCLLLSRRGDGQLLPRLCERVSGPYLAAATQRITLPEEMQS